MIKPHIVRVPRQTLYDNVWTEPIENVGKRYGLTEHTIRDMCRRYDIPMPDWGCWERLRIETPIINSTSDPDQSNGPRCAVIPMV